VFILIKNIIITIFKSRNDFLSRNDVLFGQYGISSSPELKSQVSYSDRMLSVVHLSVNFYIFDFSTTTWPILTRLGTNHPQGEVIQVCSNEALKGGALL
jgi:hypothetical protein